MSPNQAAWSLASKAKPLVVQDAPMPKPGPMQVVIQSKVIALVSCHNLMYCSGTKTLIVHGLESRGMEGPVWSYQFLT